VFPPDRRGSDSAQIAKKDVQMKCSFMARVDGEKVLCFQ
jgi:hypothetical protein